MYPSHFSITEPLPETLARHYANADDLLPIAVGADAPGGALTWEPSRGGALFPHLYAPLATTAVRWYAPIARDADGGFVLPPEIA